MKVLVSAIVPVYNSEKFLEVCIQSLKNQTLNDIEMIFINDGSTDNSLEILEKYQKLDNRIIIINQENKGPSVARNAGLRIAKGEYISFIDSDDWINENMYQEMYQNAQENNSDAVICDMKLIGKNNELYINGITLNIPFYNKEKVLQHIYQELLSNSQFNSAANKLYKSRIIKSHNISFNKEIYYAEDWLFNVDFFDKVSNVSYINKAFYYYRRGHESSSSSYDDNTFERTGLWLYNMRKKLAWELGNNPYLGVQELFNVIIHCINCEFKRNDIDSKNKRKNILIILESSETREVINYLPSFNLSNTKKILYYFIRHKCLLLLRIYFGIGNIKCKFL